MSVQIEYGLMNGDKKKNIKKSSSIIQCGKELTVKSYGF